MEPDCDNPVLGLYLLARDGGEPLISDVQRNAILMLGDLAVRGNEQARATLLRLYNLPGYHVLLREMAAASLGITAPPFS